MTNEEYHKHEGLSASDLKFILTNGVFNYLNKNKIIQNKENLDLGSYLHSAVLEPHKTDLEFAVMPKVNKTTKDGKETYKRFVEDNQGKVIVEVEDNHFVCIDNVRKYLNDFSFLNGEVEKSIILKDDDFCITRKIRPDIINDNYIVDLKFMSAKNLRELTYAFIDYKYYIQASYYIDTAFLYDKKIRDFIFLVCIKQTGLVYPIKLSNSDIEKGREEYKMAINKYEAYLFSKQIETKTITLFN